MQQGASQAAGRKTLLPLAHLHGEGADHHLSTAEAQGLVGLSALRCTGRSQGVLTCTPRSNEHLSQLSRC